MTLDKQLEQIPLPNRTYLRDFVRHKLLAGLSEVTVRNYINSVRKYLGYCDKDLAETTREDIENFVLYLKEHSEVSSQAVILISLRVFFTDLLGEKKCRELTGGIHIRQPPTKVRDDELLTNEEIRRMIGACKSERDRALISLLYSTGCRHGEIIGLKMKDVTFSRYGASIHVKGKTGERDVDLFVGVPELKAWINVHPHRDDPDAPLWVCINGRDTTKRLTQQNIWQMLQRTAERAGVPKGKRYYPHAFRHKRATDCADFMTIADMKEMFGWTQGSDMPSVYVHSSRKRVAEKLMQQAGIKVPEQKMPTSMVKQCPVCGCVNSGNAVICASCGSALEEKMAVVDKELRNFLREHMDEILAYKKEHEKKDE